MAGIDTKNKATTPSQALSNIAIQESTTPRHSRVVIISFISVIIVAEHSKPVKEHMSPPIKACIDLLEIENNDVNSSTRINARDNL